MKFKRNVFSKIVYLLPRVILVSIFLFYVIFAFLTYFDYFEPYLYPLHFIRGKAVRVTEHIMLGPYPHYEELKRCKEKYNIVYVVSLLNQNLPAEKALYEREKRNAEKLGLKVFSFPMEYLPLESESNKKTLKSLIKFIRENNGRNIYIHCYLGTHRVKLVKRELIKEDIIWNPDVSK